MSTLTTGMRQRDLFRDDSNATKTADDAKPRTIEECLQPLLDQLPEPPSELEYSRLVECMTGFPLDAIAGAVQLHIERFAGSGFFISRLFLENAAKKLAGVSDDD